MGEEKIDPQKMGEEKPYVHSQIFKDMCNCVFVVRHPKGKLKKKEHNSKKKSDRKRERKDDKHARRGEAFYKQ